MQQRKLAGSTTGQSTACGRTRGGDNTKEQQGQQLEPWCTVTWHTSVEVVRMTSSAAPHRWVGISQNQSMRVHHLLNDREQSHVCMSRSTELKCWKPNVRVSGNKQGATGVILRDTLHRDSQSAHHVRCVEGTDANYLLCWSIRWMNGTEILLPVHNCQEDRRTGKAGERANSSNSSNSPIP